MKMMITISLMKTISFRSYERRLQIDTSMHPENVSTDSSCIALIQVKSEIASKVKTGGEHNDSDRIL